jgi:hypothetical protein
MQINGKAISPKKRKEGEKKSGTGKPRHRSGKKNPNDYDEMRRLGKDELRRTVGSKRVNGKAKGNSAESS